MPLSLFFLLTRRYKISPCLHHRASLNQQVGTVIGRFNLIQRGWNAGVSLGYGSQRSGLSFFVDANKALGKENGDSDSYTETNLTAGKTLTLQSGRDTSLTGALVTGDKVVVDVGRDFTLTSQQAGVSCWLR